ncbi:hypothetical protein DYB25_001194 [Aphanomyces astaci]|uniref:BZIP domain-containing protein n=1 Tax=Aphanomyces astaci TaxID=112090 RepID=A0A397AE83_APHAT|nr:hypothetical protein DYB36_005356 [Aphanomyces astaci]RHY03957.1 hypothetical protein DYB25_001194 [Aphanomyces astaci]RHY74408.1 hypothetical protein DYB30_011687 [Aphanomyces astaci]
MDKEQRKTTKAASRAAAAASSAAPSSNIRPEMYQWLVHESQKHQANLKKHTPATGTQPPNLAGLQMLGMPHLHSHAPPNVLQMQQLNQMLPLMSTYPGFLGFGGLNQPNAATTVPSTAANTSTTNNPLNLFSMTAPPSKSTDTTSASSDDAVALHLLHHPMSAKTKPRTNSDVKSDLDGAASYENNDISMSSTNPLRKRRLERNRESARECRRRKRDHILGVEERCKLLEKENMELRSQLKAGKEAMKQEEDEKYQICHELEHMITEGASEQDLAAKIDNFKEVCILGGFRTRRSALSYHLHQLERLLMPTQVTKMCIWALKQDDAFWEDGEDETSLLSILTHDLGLTEEQRKNIQSHRGAIVKICDNLRLALKLLNELKQDVEEKNITLDTEMDQLQNILTPTQRAKFIVWVTNNPACMHLLNKLCFGLFSGAYQSLKVLHRQERHSQCRHVLKFWAVLGSIMLFGQYMEGFVSWVPFYYWVKCIVVGGLLLPKAKLHVVAFESAVVPAVESLDALFAHKIKPELLRLAGLYGQWLHEAVMHLALPSLSDAALDKLEKDLSQRLADIQVKKMLPPYSLPHLSFACRQPRNPDQFSQYSVI